MNKDNLGFKGEEVACGYLENENWQILDRNFSCNQGEIDIVGKDKEEIVFIEVKTRTNNSYGNPIDAVDKYKLKHIINTAKYYCYINNLNNEFIRFDIIEIFLINTKYKINHIKNILM